MFASFNTRALGLEMTANAAIAQAASAGFGGVDLLVRDLVEAGDDPAGLRARMDDLGLRGGAWPLPVDWRGAADRFRADLRRLPRYAEAAAVLGLDRTGTWVMPETPEAPVEGPARLAHARQVFDLHVRRLGAIARILEDHGTRLGLEVIGVESFRTGRGMPFLGRLGSPAVDDLLGALRVESPGVGVLVDTFHLYAAGEPMDSAWARGIDRVVWVHVADLAGSADLDRAALRDRDRGLPGERGAIDVRTFLRQLAGLGYDGPVTVEPLAGCRSLAGLDPTATAHRVASAVRAAWPYGDSRPASPWIPT